MIRYALRCDNGHDFDGWFRDSDGFEALNAAGQVACTHCGSTTVEKALMAPRVSHGQDGTLTAPRDPQEAALDKLRRHVEESSDYVGMAGIDLNELGIPDEQTYLATYCRRIGRAPVDPATWRFCIAFGLFKVAAILQGVMKRALEGSASNANAHSAGGRASAIAERGWRIANGDTD